MAEKLKSTAAATNAYASEEARREKLGRTTRPRKWAQDLPGFDSSRQSVHDA